MREAESKEVELLEDRPEAFGFILNYLYDKAFRTRTLPNHCVTFDNLIHAWMLADRLLMENGQNAIMDVIQATIMKASDEKRLVRRGLRVLQVLETKPARTSSLHRFLVDRFAWDMKNTQTHLTTGPTPRLIQETEEFFEGGGGIVVDVFNAFTLCMGSSSATSDPAFGRGCTYHEHKDGSERACWRHSTTPSTPKPAPKPAGSGGGGGLFGTTPQNKPTTNLFGHSNTASTSSGFSFGQTNTNTSTSGAGGLFGSSR